MSRIENVDLVDDDDHLLAPAADLLEKRALGLGERTVGGRHEQDEVRARDEIRGDRLVLADDRVRSRRIDDVNVAQDRGGRGDHVQRGIADLPRRRLAVLQHVDLRRCRRHSLQRHLCADQRIDERALSGIEFADDDEQEQFVELLDRLVERCLMFGSCLEPDQRRLQAREDLPLLAEQLILSR